MSALPIPCVFQDDAFHPLKGFVKVAREHYGEGEIVALAPIEERSHATHAHFFATFKDLWASLPEDLAAQFPTPDLWRKRLLIKTGFADCQTIVCATKAEALRWAAIIRPMVDLVLVEGVVVTCWTAHSQSYRTMNKATFAESKQRVLDAAADVLGMGAPELDRARQHAGVPA